MNITKLSLPAIGRDCFGIALDSDDDFCDCGCQAGNDTGPCDEFIPTAVLSSYCANCEYSYNEHSQDAKGSN